MTRDLTSSRSILARIRMPSWDDAACATEFGLRAFSSSLPAAQDIARSICAGCPIQRRCLQWGVLYEDEGMWGGLTRDEIRHERKRHGIQRQEPWTEFLVSRPPSKQAA